MGFPDGSNVKESACSVGDLGSILVLGRFPWRQDCLPSPVFLPGEFHGQTSLAGYSPVQFSSVTQLSPTLCNPIDCSMPGFRVHHHLQELPQNHVHRVEWCHPTISSSVVPSSSCLQSFPASASFPVSQFFTSGGQSIGASASTSILPRNIQDWFPLGLIGLISLQSRGLSRVFSNTSSKASILQHSAFFVVWLSHPYMTTGKTIALTRQIFVGKVMSLLFNMLSSLVITFLPRSKRLLISWLQPPSAVILEPKKIESVSVSLILHVFAMKWWEWMPRS